MCQGKEAQTKTDSRDSQTIIERERETHIHTHIESNRYGKTYREMLLERMCTYVGMCRYVLVLNHFQVISLRAWYVVCLSSRHFQNFFRIKMLFPYYHFIRFTIIHNWSWSTIRNFVYILTANVFCKKQILNFKCAQKLFRLKNQLLKTIM